MKISSASKKVLASALSAAMVVAFAPTVALAATNTGGNAQYGQEEIGHNLDNGVVTKAPTCSTEGIMTYTCADGDGYTVLAPIAQTDVHNYSLDATKGYEKSGYDWTNKVAYLVCEGGEKIIVKAATGSTKPASVTTAEWAAAKTGTITVTTESTPATFFAPGKTVDTAKVEYNKQSFTVTKTTDDAIYGITGLAASDYTTGSVFTDGNATARIKLTAGGKEQILSVATTSKVKTPATESAKGTTTYKAVFDLPEGVFFDDKITITGITDKTSAEVKNGKLTVTKDVQDIDATTAHVVAKAGTVGSGVTITDAVLATNAPEKATSTDGVTITYSGSGSIKAGTATETAGAWTIEAVCSNAAHSDKTAVTKQVAKSVSKSTCDTGAGTATTIYTIEYEGGTYELTVGHTSTATKAKHAYEAGETVWSKITGGYQATTVYTCPIDNDEYTVVLNTKGEATVTHNSSADTTHFKAGVTNKSVAATCEAKGADAFDLVLQATTGNDSYLADIVEKLGVTTAASINIPLPKLSHVYKASVDFVGTTKAIVKVVCAGAEKSETKTYDLSAKHTNVAIAADGAVTPGYTTYSAEITLPEGVKAIDPSSIVSTGNGVYFDAETGVYTVKKTVTDTVNVSVHPAVDAEGFAPTSDPSKWTVADSATSKSYAVTAISVADIAHTKDAPKVQKAYTLTYDNGKTVTVDCTGLKDAHTWTVAYYDITGATTGNMKGYITTITPYLTCECGDLVAATPIAMDTTSVTEAKVMYAGKEIAKVNLGKFIATNVVYSADPTFKWDTTGWTGIPTCEATFVSADGKMKVTVDCKVTLTDPSTSTWTATVEKANIPEGFSGKVLSDTKVINLHEGHSMVLTEVVKATTTKAGFATYYCNNCAKDYKVVIAKNNMKVSPTSKTFKASVVKKKAQSVTIKVTNAKGKVSYSVAAKTKKAGVSVSSKGKVTVKKGTAKGTYKVTVTSKATDTYAKATKTVTIRVK